MAVSASGSDAQLLPPPETENQLSSIVYDLSNEVQGAMENMLKMINEINQNSAAITQEMGKSKESALERKRVLEEEKEHFQKAAYTVLDMLTNRD
ncbi:Polyamine-modulated factor 1-binding protein [Quillaja saponaria]|uniref:Polyamine-modulated factor 1-binding protein n=1 Tax=Quillaja saponaria TaxID=32244 RepID=A0AAD7LIJ0_QUISA|nr:Polyamine-modulated factor 1-binding protein [Quillaja saponaria]